MAIVFSAGLAASSVLGGAVPAGLSFLAGTAAAARYTRRAYLLTATATPPVLFFGVLSVAKFVTATGDVPLSAASGIALALAGTAPWIFAGTAASLAIAWCRGLRRCVRDLRQPPRPPAVWDRGRPGQRSFASGQGTFASPQ
jgi:hypothetical protein